MASAEQTPAGPCYAPDDPTLPLPWRGLIDGSTDVLQYWNPNTNLTQYKTPPSLPIPLMPSQLTSASAAATGPASGSNTQPGDMAGQLGENVQTQVPQGLQTGSSLRDSQQLPLVTQQISSVSAQAGQQQGPISTQQPAPQYMKQPYQQYIPWQQMPHHQFPVQQRPIYQGPQMGQYKRQFPNNQMPCMGYQQNSYPRELQIRNDHHFLTLKSIELNRSRQKTVSHQAKQKGFLHLRININPEVTSAF